MKKIILSNSVPVKISKKNPAVSLQAEISHNLKNSKTPVFLGGSLVSDDLGVGERGDVGAPASPAKYTPSPINNMGGKVDNQCFVVDAENSFDWDSLLSEDYKDTGLLGSALISFEQNKDLELIRSSTVIPAFDDGTEKITIVSKGSKGGHALIRIPQKNTVTDKSAAFVDQCSFTVRVADLLSRELIMPYSSLPGGMRWTESDIVPRMSSILLNIFGFAATHQRALGVNFYKVSWDIGEKDGILSCGGQNDTVNVQISGQGAAKAHVGWEYRLYDYLMAVGGWLSRCDLAADFYQGQYTPEQAERDYLSGLMSNNGRPPFAERRGDWYTDQGGKTFYIGKRTSGKLLRVYEKGLQLLGMIALKNGGCDDRILELLKWVRVECEWHNQDRILPLEMLINSGPFLAGSYPALAFIDVTQSRIETKQKSVILAVSRAIEIVKHQFGPIIYSLYEIYGNDLIPMIIREKLAKFAKPFNELLPVDDEQNESWDKVLSSIPF